VGSNPILGTQYPLRQDAVLGSEVELLGGGDGDVVQAVQESEDVEGGVGFGDGAECGVGDAVGCVDDCLGRFSTNGGEAPFQAVAVYAEGGALFARCGG
jgi:hypothetical protein